MHPTVSPRVSCTPPAVGEKDRLLRCLPVRMQLPELDTHLPRRLHHVLVHQRLRLHRNELSAGQRESGLTGLQRFLSFGPPLIEASRFLTLSLCRCAWWVAWFTQWRANGNKGAKSALARSCRTGTQRCTSLSVYRPCAIGRVLRWSRLNTEAHAITNCSVYPMLYYIH